MHQVEILLDLVDAHTLSADIDHMVRSLQRLQPSLLLQSSKHRQIMTDILFIPSRDSENTTDAVSFLQSQRPSPKFEGSQNLFMFLIAHKALVFSNNAGSTSWFLYTGQKTSYVRPNVQNVIKDSRTGKVGRCSNPHRFTQSAFYLSTALYLKIEGPDIKVLTTESETKNWRVRGL